LHHFKHPRDDLLQEFCLFADELVRDLVRKEQNALQPIQKAQRDLVVLVLFLQELNGQALPLLLIRRSASTNLECGAYNTEGSLCDWMELKGVSAVLVGFHIGERTSANAAPYLINLSKVLSIDGFINGEYFSNNPSSSWSVERRNPAYSTIIS